MKKIFKKLSVLMGACLMGVGLYACDSTTTASAEELSYIGMRINPEIELVVDADDEVVAVNAVNEDGETVLCEISLVGMSASEAAEAFTAAATELGFIDVNAEDNAVYIYVDGEKAEALKEEISEKVNGYFDEKGIFGKALPEEAKAEIIAYAKELGVSVKDAKLVERILKLYPEMTEEEVLALTFEERLELIKEDCKKNGFTADVREEYKQAVDALKAEYEEMFALKAEMHELEKQLRDKGLTEDERVAIKTEYEALKAEYEALRTAYEEEIKALKETYGDKIEAAKEQFKEIARNKRAAFEEQLEEHKKKFEQRKEEIQEEVEKWREAWDGMREQNPEMPEFPEIPEIPEIPDEPIEGDGEDTNE